MLMPTLFGENLFDDWMGFPFRDFDEMEKELYGKRAAHVMKTDVREKDGSYELEIDLPGFKKDEVTAKLENGYLTIEASKNHEKDEKDEKSGKYLRRERYSGSMSRSYYVGSHVQQSDVTAKFEDGILKLTIPKEDPKALESKKFIAIEG